MKLKNKTNLNGLSKLFDFYQGKLLEVGTIKVIQSKNTVDSIKNICPITVKLIHFKWIIFRELVAQSPSLTQFYQETIESLED